MVAQYYVKVCQFSSSRLDILPHIWIEKFATLQDDVPPKPAPEIVRIVERSYGKPIDEVFESFDAEHPLGSASIGQCHLAKLKVWCGWVGRATQAGRNGRDGKGKLAWFAWLASSCSPSSLPGG